MAGKGFKGDVRDEGGGRSECKGLRDEGLGDRKRRLKGLRGEGGGTTKQWRGIREVG